jgi:hypothetical protein
VYIATERKKIGSQALNVQMKSLTVDSGTTTNASSSGNGCDAIA